MHPGATMDWASRQNLGALGPDQTPADPTTELPPKKGPSRRRTRGGSQGHTALARGRRPRCTEAKEGSFTPPPIGPRVSRESAGTPGGLATAPPNPRRVGGGRHGPPLATSPQTALPRRHLYTGRRSEKAALGQSGGVRLLARKAPPSQGRRSAAGQLRGTSAASCSGSQAGSGDRKVANRFRTIMPLPSRSTAARCCHHAARFRRLLLRRLWHGLLCWLRHWLGCV